jgi:hypothetical protein
MGLIVLRFMYFDECTINKSNTTLELQELCTQDPLLFNSRPSDLINNGGFIQDVIKMPLSFVAVLFQFHINASYFVTLSYFMEKLKFNKHCFGVNLDGNLKF